MSAALIRYRKAIETGLRQALGGETKLLSILRYHVGVTDIGGRPVDAMGKLLRPGLVLLTAEHLGGEHDDALPAAVALEFVHNFSLIHDDIEDRDRTRRGRPTVWALHGVNQAINAGDLMLSIAIRTALAASSAAVEKLIDATAEMIEGQSLDLEFESRTASVNDYLEMIDHKTGALLRCAFELGAMTAGADEVVRSRLVEMSRGIGRAFQIQDDLLGIWGNGELVGKPQGSDIRRRKKSFPVAVAFERVPMGERDRLASIYEQGEVPEEDVQWVIALLDSLNVRSEGERWVNEQLKRARLTLDHLPFSESGRKEMEQLIGHLAGRKK